MCLSVRDQEKRQRHKHSHTENISYVDFVRSLVRVLKHGQSVVVKVYNGGVVVGVIVGVVYGTCACISRGGSGIA